MSSRDVQIEDIPMAVLDQVENGLRHYSVPILALWKRKPVPDFRLIGSGTLMDVAGKGYILTAAHVWNAAAGADSLQVLMKAGRARVEIPRADISARTIWNRDGPEEWGPDLAFLEIPPQQLGALRARKSFLNFEHQLADLAENPPQIEKGLWAQYGVVDEFSDVNVDIKNKQLNAELVTRAFFGGVTQTHSIDGFDYYDTRADLWLDGVPSSFGGVSGGGLWQIGLSISKAGDISWDEKRHFRGVAFWQSSAINEQRIVRFHGPTSIFERARSVFGWGVREMGGRTEEG